MTIRQMIVGQTKVLKIIFCQKTVSQMTVYKMMNQSLNDSSSNAGVTNGKC